MCIYKYIEEKRRRDGDRKTEGDINSYTEQATSRSLLMLSATVKTLSHIFPLSIKL